ncbi:hypothetical protein RB195_006031 [Necator americanus]|uniref:Reverse transcriptase domain-containing protein n=1 Tax=Necator americanus TaxID=51031 RepID=A0ABR1BS63_NECAM
MPARSTRVAKRQCPLSSQATSGIETQTVKSSQSTEQDYSGRQNAARPVLAEKVKSGFAEQLEADKRSPSIKGDKAEALVMHSANAFPSNCGDTIPEIVGIAPVQQQCSNMCFHPIDIYEYFKSLKPSEFYGIYDDENYHEVRTALQTSLAKMSDWASEWDLHINYDKSLVIHLGFVSQRNGMFPLKKSHQICFLEILSDL